MAENSSQVRITNQIIINAFARAAAALGNVDPWALMARSGLNLALLVSDREGTYTGPGLETLPNLTAAERAALVEALEKLTNANRPAPPPPVSGALRLNPELLAVALAPVPARAIANPPGNDRPGAQMMGRIWNQYGGLLDKVSEVLSVDPAIAASVLAIESGGRAFGASGRMIIRFELHVFYNLWGKNNQELFDRYFRVDPSTPWRGESHQWRASEDAEWQAVHAGQEGEWNAFGFARVKCNDTGAKLAISMGAPQIMGFNHSRIGYGDVDAMYDAFENSERAQVLGFFDFVRTDSRLLDAARKEELLVFATYYNGITVAETYARLMRDALGELRRILPAPAAPPPVFPDTGKEVGPHGIDSTSPVPRTGAPVVRNGVPEQAQTPIPLPDQLPLPPTTEAGLLRDMDPTLYGYWREHVREGFEQNSEMFDRILDAFMEPYYTTVWMYRVIFSVGVLAFIAAVGLSIWTQSPWYGLVFGGLSAAAFLSYFFNRPLQALEENLHFITWLGIIYNTYWTRLAYMFDQKTVQQDLHTATTDAVQELDKLLDKHAQLSGKRPNAS